MKFFSEANRLKLELLDAKTTIKIEQMRIVQIQEEYEETVAHYKQTISQLKSLINAEIEKKKQDVAALQDILEKCEIRENVRSNMLMAATSMQSRESKHEKAEMLKEIMRIQEELEETEYSFNGIQRQHKLFDQSKLIFKGHEKPGNYQTNDASRSIDSIDEGLLSPGESTPYIDLIYDNINETKKVTTTSRESVSDQSSMVSNVVGVFRSILPTWG